MFGNGFYIEAYNQEVLSNPEKLIINKGGHASIAFTSIAIFDWY